MHGLGLPYAVSRRVRLPAQRNGRTRGDQQKQGAEEGGPWEEKLLMVSIFVELGQEVTLAYLSLWFVV